MKKYVAVLGRQPLISVAELESLFSDVRLIAPNLAEFSSSQVPDINRLGGTLKIAAALNVPVEQFFASLPATGKVTLGVSDFSKKASVRSAQQDALHWKRLLINKGHSVRIVPNQSAVLSSATTLHNKLYKELKIELIKHNHDYYRVISVQQIDAYVKRDQARPARDAKVGMLPPKLAQILINLCGNLPARSVLLDPFCGTGVVLQEATLMGYTPYGTDINERMVEYSKKNLAWLLARGQNYGSKETKVAEKMSDEAALPNHITDSESQVSALIQTGDATNFVWTLPINAVACETYLGPPMSQAPADIKLKQAKQECKSIIIGFLKNLSAQIKPDTPVVIAIPAWLRPDGRYERLNLLDEIEKLRYNVVRFKDLGQKDLLYHRDGQVVAREIIVLRKK